MTTLLLVAQATQAATAAAPVEHWYDGLAAVATTAFGAVITFWFIPLLKAQAAKAAAERDKTQAEATGALTTRLKAYLWGNAARIAEAEFPKLSADVVAKAVATPEAIKAALYSWGAELRADAVAYFKLQGVDLLTQFGEDNLDDLIQRAANYVSPFPGKSTAVELLKAGVAAELLKQGVTYVRGRYLSAGTPPPAAGDPGTAPAPAVTPPPGTFPVPAAAAPVPAVVVPSFPPALAATAPASGGDVSLVSLGIVDDPRTPG